MENALTVVANGAAGPGQSTCQPFKLSRREQAVLLGLQKSGADEAPPLMDMLLRDLRKAPTTKQREQALAPYADALARRGQDLTTLEGLLLSVLNTGASRAAWHTLMQASPGVGSVAALAQFAQAIYSRSWSGVTTALTALAPLLPAVRNIEQVDQLILALPEALRNQLDVLHQQIQQMDDALTPNLGIRELGPALAICTLLWYAQRRLPAPSSPLRGLSGFIARLPDYWQRLVALDRTGSTLFRQPHVNSTALALLGGAFEERSRFGNRDIPRDVKEAMVRCRRATYQGDLSNCPYPDELVEQFRRPHMVGADLPLDVAVAPSSLQSGGDIAQAPELPRDAAASSAGSALGSGWTALCGALLTFFGQRMPQGPAPAPPEIEMSLLGRSAGQGAVPPDSVSADMATVTDRLLSNDPSAAVAAVGGKLGKTSKISLLYRHPFAAAAVITGFVGTVVGSVVYYLTRPSDEPLSTLDIGEALFRDRVVSVKGRWGTGADLLLGTPSLPGKREKREATEPAADDLDQLGISAAQRDSVLADSELTAHLRALQVLSLATAQDVAAQDGWQWVARLPASEQELLVSQLYVLHSLDAALKGAEAMPQILLDDALQAAGWNSGGAGITVDLGTARVAGTRVEQQMPLLHYCLMRAGDTPPSAVSFRDSAGVLSDSQQAQLRAFTATAACTGLQSSVVHHSDTLRPLLQDALRARLVIDALQAKSQRVLGSGDMQLRGADIVLGFLQGAQDIESSTLIYADTLEDGKKVSLHVPNYLVLRSASEDLAVRGQVVVYRADLASFRSFESERAFREYLDAYRASGSMHVVDGELDRALIEDIIAAAPPALRPQVRERIAGWTEGQNMFQAGKTGRLAWNARDSFTLDFKPVSQEGQGLQAWSTALVNQGQQQKQQQLESNRLRWTPLGIANAAAEAAYATHLRDHVKTLHDHARPELTTELVRALRNAGVSADLQAFNPDQVTLRLGGQAMSLTDWAINGWQQHGWSRPELPVNLGDAPDAGVGLPAQRLSDDPWPSAEELYTLKITANRTVNGSADAVPDEALTRALHSEPARRAICTVLEELAESNRLAERYIAHLRQLAADRNGGLHMVAADQIRTHLRWMIEEAHSTGQLEVATYTALIASHAGLEPARGRPSSLKAVTLNGHAINGLWSLAAGSTRYVFVPATAAGDQLMREDDFRRWLQRPESEDYVLSRAALRHHEDLEEMFRKRASAGNIRLDFAPTQGPRQAARAYIDARVSDVDEMTVSRLERFTQALTIFGSVVAAASCTLASGGSMFALCATSTLALFAKGLHDGVDMLERGRVHVNEAIENIGGSLIDLLDVLNLGAIPGLLYRLGREVDSVTSARRALDQLQRQARGFSEQGKVNAAFAVSTSSLRESGLPPLKLARADGDVYAIGGKQYVRQDGRYLQVTDDGADLRLVDPQAPADVGPPLTWSSANKQWELKKLAPPRPGATTPRPTSASRAVKPEWVKAVPEAETLPVETLHKLEAVFGFEGLKRRPDTQLLQTVRELNQKARIQQICEAPQTLGLPGDEALILRSWSDNPALGNGHSVEVYTEELGEWTRVARFGNGPVGVWVRADDARSLPTLDALVDAADQDALRQRLGLAQDASHEALMAAVRDALGGTVAANPAQSLTTWQRWNAVQHRLPAAADNLVKHFPQLTRAEAEALVSSDPTLRRQAESWVFPKQTAEKVDDLLSNRSRSRHREAVVEGKIRSLSEVQELREHLQRLIPGRKWSVNSETGTQAPVLMFRRQSQENVVGQLGFDAEGRPYVPGAAGNGDKLATWQDGVFAQLTSAEQQALPDPEGLRLAVVNQMKKTPLTSKCALPRPIETKAKRAVDTYDAPERSRSDRVKSVNKRSLDCNPPRSISLTSEEVSLRDALGEAMQHVRNTMADKHVKFSAEEAELRQLREVQAKQTKKGMSLEPAALTRLRELEKKPFDTLKNFDIMNFASYQLDGLTYQGVPVVLPDGFPLRGTAGSGNPRPMLSVDGLVEGAPVRRVLIPEAEAHGKPSLSGWFKEDYAVGADPAAVVAGRSAEKGQASQLITLTQEDLLVSRPGSEDKVPLHELSKDDILKLGMSDYSPKLKDHIGFASLLPSNARALTPGDYRMYQIRSCSEGKILDNWFDAMATSLPDLSSHLKGHVPGPINALTGRLYVFSEMNLCAVSCERRGKELLELVPGMDIRFFYQFENNGHRKQWLLDQKLSRIIQKNRDAWESDGVAEDAIRDKARAELSKAEVVRWLQEEFKARPPEQPVARLWVQTDTNEF